ncbi:MAG: pilus assembly protein N-terminal domain-containing protein [Rhizomicrobium sp.]
MRLRIALLAAASLIATSPAFADGKAPTHHKPIHKVAIKHRVAVRAAGGVAVTMDQVRVVSFTRPVSTVFVGNPIIADATVIDPYHVFILGKAFGVTNMIALNQQSQTVSNQQITVARSGGVVTLHKGANQFSYACTSAHCEVNPLPGDAKGFVEDNSGTVSGHQEQAIKAASAATAH